MSERYFNPFQGIDVNIPVDFHDDVARFSQREGKPISDHSSFPRMVDMWFLAMCVAASENRPPADPSKCETRKIIDGNIFSSDPWRVQMLMLVAIAQSGNLIQIVSGSLGK